MVRSSARARFSFLGSVSMFAMFGAAGCSGNMEGGDEATATHEDALRRPGGQGNRAAISVTMNGSGLAATLSTTGRIDRSNPFFQSLGTNGRACASCHVESEGWTISPAGVRARFDETRGRDPIFRTVDGSNSPRADVSSVSARRRAYSMLLDKGLIRIGLPMPSGAEFELAAVDDPYQFASARELSLFRRPLPTTNLSFLTAMMWDGRDTLPTRGLDGDLLEQANTATATHAESTRPLTTAQRREIVDFEMGLFTAQVVDTRAGRLDRDGATGGPRALSTQPFFFGINDPLGENPTGAPFDPVAFTLFRAWLSGTSNTNERDCGDHDGYSSPAQRAARASIARGERLFGTREFAVKGVRGVNDVVGVPSLTATCTTCHDSPNVGNHSVRLPLDLGLTSAARRTPDMPLYTLRHKVTGETLQTTDPGRALVTGKWKDVNLFKGPILRGLAARAPYFHNGAAASLNDVVEFYDDRFTIGLTAAERADLVAFLKAL